MYSSFLVFSLLVCEKQCKSSACRCTQSPSLFSLTEGSSSKPGCYFYNQFDQYPTCTHAPVHSHPDLVTGDGSMWRQGGACHLPHVSSPCCCHFLGFLKGVWRCFQGWGIACCMVPTDLHAWLRGATFPSPWALYSLHVPRLEEKLYGCSGMGFPAFFHKLGISQGLVEWTVTLAQGPWWLWWDAGRTEGCSWEACCCSSTCIPHGTVLLHPSWAHSKLLMCLRPPLNLWFKGVKKKTTQRGMKCLRISYKGDKSSCKWKSSKEGVRISCCLLTFSI